jgi:hypothetical protein
MQKFWNKEQEKKNSEIFFFRWEVGNRGIHGLGYGLIYSERNFKLSPWNWYHRIQLVWKKCLKKEWIHRKIITKVIKLLRRKRLWFGISLSVHYWKRSNHLNREQCLKQKTFMETKTLSKNRKNLAFYEIIYFGWRRICKNFAEK